MDWVNKSIKKVCEDLGPEENAYGRLREAGPECPNCNEQIINGVRIELIPAAALVINSPVKDKRSSFIEDLVLRNSSLKKVQFEIEHVDEHEG